MRMISVQHPSITAPQQMAQNHSRTEVSGTQLAVKNSRTAPQQPKVLLMCSVLKYHLFAFFFIWQTTIKNLLLFMLMALISTLSWLLI